MKDLEENFFRIIAEIESGPEKSEKDPILEFLLARREEIARDVQLIDQALSLAAWNSSADRNSSEMLHFLTCRLKINIEVLLLF